MQAAVAVSRLVPDLRPSQRPSGDITDRRAHRTRSAHGRRGRTRGRHRHLRNRFPCRRLPAQPRRLRRRGRRLRDDWADGAEAYLGTVVPGYPNLFTMYGPNTNGVTSIIYILEAQAEFVRRTLDKVTLHRVRAIDIKRGIHDEYNSEIQRAMQGTVWLANCNNYYRHPNGKVVTQFPYSGTTFAEMLARVELDEFDWLSPAGDRK